ncbi:hypothetical protein QCA50_017486 [Cerrena zonata]|uniref:F-box domain-containing protein n=1 Tax=Cerrena zonata TaxID=2478898 RepID=A0AAW0FGP7_9APHY
MPKASTRKKPDVRSSIPTRIQPKRACNCKRSAEPIDPSSLPPSKRIRTETVGDKPAKKTVGRPKRNLPPKHNTSKDTSHSKRERQSTTKAKRKRLAPEDDLGDDESRPESTSPIKRRRLDQPVNKAPSPIPDTRTPPWHLPIELLYHIYDCLWDHEHVECYSTATLRSCALTCSRWRDAVRPYIFRFITLDTPEAINRFSHQIRATPEIIQWVRKLRLVGRTLPFIDEPRWHRLDAADDIDQWLYAFPANVDAHFPCLRILELFNFAQISPRLEDREAYARWIPELTKLKSVTTLNILRCEMSANNLTALVRALPDLTTVNIVDAEFGHPNLTVLQEMPTEDSDNEPTGDHIVEATEATKYPVFYPPPLLQSFRMDTSQAEYGLDFTLLRGWFRPELLAKHLESFEVAGAVDSEPFYELILALGEAPNLSHIQIPVGSGTFERGCIHGSPYAQKLTVYDSVFELGIDLSRFTNLTSIRLIGRSDEWGQDEEVNNIRQFLGQLKAPKLRMVAIQSHFQKEEEIDMIASIDQSLADSKFDGLEAIRIELIVDRVKRPSQWYREKVTELLPLTAKRGILIVDYPGWDLPYLSYISGA